MPNATEAPALALVRGRCSPLRAPLADFEPDTLGVANTELPVGTLLATQSGWDWIATHLEAVDTAVHTFADAILAHPTPATDTWVCAHVPDGFTLITRQPTHGVLAVALLELDWPTAVPGTSHSLRSPHHSDVT